MMDSRVVCSGQPSPRPDPRPTLTSTEKSGIRPWRLLVRGRANPCCRRHLRKTWRHLTRNVMEGWLIGVLVLVGLIIVAVIIALIVLFVPTSSDTTAKAVRVPKDV